VKLKNTIHVVEETLGAKLTAGVVEANVTALRRAYDEVKEG
jgi:Pyruvate/2-oxoacid:ferredoxin oxidoreductase gamma subunit